MLARIHKIYAYARKHGISQAMKQERWVFFFQGQNTSGVGAVCLCTCVPKVSHSSALLHCARAVGVISLLYFVLDRR